MSRGVEAREHLRPFVVDFSGALDTPRSSEGAAGLTLAFGSEAVEGEVRLKQASGEKLRELVRPYR